jgi:DASS family divalent anion:Na+ symporter
MAEGLECQTLDPSPGFRKRRRELIIFAVAVPGGSLELKPLAFFLALLLGVSLWFLPAPEGLALPAWRMFAIFMATLVAIVSEALPLGAIAVLGFTVTAATGVLGEQASPAEALGRALSGFSDPIPWLIVAAFLIARGFIRSGLGARIAFHFVRRFGRTPLGLSYALIAADALLSPVIPSNTARGGGIVFPLARSLAGALGSQPEDASERKVGSFLLFAAFQGNCLTSALFPTAMAANPLALELAAAQGIELGFGDWALAAAAPTLSALVVVPLYLYRAYPPEIRSTPAAPEWASERLAELGPLSRDERTMLGTFVLLLGLWVGGGPLGLHPTTTAFVGLAILLIGRVLSWEDIKREEGAWDVLIWFSVLLMMAKNLNDFGFTRWLGAGIAGQLEGLPWPAAFVLLSLAYCFVHYFLASQTAHIAALYGVFLAVGTSLGVPGALFALTLAFASNYFASTTIYGTSVAPIYYQSGYIKNSDWMKHGLVILLVNLAIFLGLGSVWMKLLGFF